MVGDCPIPLYRGCYRGIADYRSDPNGAIDHSLCSARSVGRALAPGLHRTMRITSLSPLALAKATMVAAAVLTACEDDVVYQDRPPFNPPPAAAASFLGYYDAPTQK